MGGVPPGTLSALAPGRAMRYATGSCRRGSMVGRRAGKLASDPIGESRVDWRRLRQPGRQEEDRHDGRSRLGCPPVMTGGLPRSGDQVQVADRPPRRGLRTLIWCSAGCSTVPARRVWVRLSQGDSVPGGGDGASAADFSSRRKVGRGVRGSNQIETPRPAAAERNSCGRRDGARVIRRGAGCTSGRTTTPPGWRSPEATRARPPGGRPRQGRDPGSPRRVPAYRSATGHQPLPVGEPEDVYAAWALHARMIADP